ncbi:translocation/assembly module TamB domain-containing protein [Sphingosinicella sp. LY1275]|uniref:translocation/assembly module TamB domain-containing protein n=1 Tax=Sphingosinicella sp. LY1275 TaxID=3095379 RepID=UPI002ADEE13B|nr:translocation/assembly module TamB domain-containing protein [Sphingosinicella sp. LY1275]MEA1014501.1 translocation/assembly module TamB domain-containing protein [Sphingosinicella sp. LY1275]
MASDTVLDTPAPATPAPRGRGATIAKWAGIAAGVLLLLVAALYFGLNTELGRGYVVRQINNLETASGLDIDVGRIEGSIYGELIIHDITLKDPKGVFLTAPRAELDWRPFAYFRNHIDIKALSIPEAHLRRLPELKPGDPNAPTLPDIDIDIGRFDVGRLLVGPAVTGQRHLLRLSGGAKIADRRAQVSADVAAIVAPGFAGGDRLTLRLDAVPDDNLFDVDARIRAPADGFVAGLAGLDQPLVAALEGKGSWKDWKGRARADLGGQGFANLAITGRDGTFQVNGPVRPALMMAEGPLQRLVTPLVQMNLVTALAERRADTRLRLTSPVAAVAAEGVIDLGRSEFNGLRVAARLTRPGAIAPNLSGRDVRLAMVLNGAFARPVVAYDLQAAALGFDGTIVEGLRARGRARATDDRITIPVSATARRISGLNPAIGGLLTNVALEGTFNMAGSSILSADLRIRSDKLNATAVIAANVARGEYRAGIQGRINNYLVEGIGLLDIDSNLDVVSEGQGFGIRGKVAVRTRRIDNASARDFLGGNAIVTAQLEMDSAGLIRLNAIRLASPQLRITSGSGVYRPNGTIDFRLAGNSTAYGPLAVTITGTASAPNVHLRASRPGFGIGLANVDARIRATANGYRITATGTSQYGPFSADVTVLTGRGPMTIDVHRLLFAGFTFTGRVVQTAAGPYAGTLRISGQGVDGVVRLAAAGRYQRADISARANGATIPGETPILIQRGIVQATAILYPTAPSIVGDVQLAGLRSGQFQVETARARINYQGGRGNAQIVAQGRSGVPYRVAANVALTPDHIRAAAQGTINRLAFRLARPADIRKVGRDWVLAPATLVFPQGNVRLAGRWGNGLSIQSRMENLDLSIVNAFAPALGLGGRANGSLDFAQPTGASFPQADARITITDFTRTGVATLSEPVNIALVGQLRPTGGALAAVIRRQGAVIGRLQARLQPLSPSAGGWMTRLLASPLSGGIRYNGPAQVLWSLTGIADQQLSGPIGIAADFSGRVQNPQFTGVVRATNLTFVDETFGTRITNLALQGRFTSSTFEITQLNGRAGSGTVTGNGRVSLAAGAGFPVDIRLVFDRAQLARSESLGATVSGEVAVTNSPANGALISGDLRLPEVRYQIIRQGAAEVVELQGVHRKGEPLVRPDEMVSRDAPPSIWKLDLRLRAENEVFVSGMGLESEWGTDLRVRGTTSAPVITGSAEVIRGTISFAGNRFNLTTGEVEFTGSTPMDPRLNVVAEGEVEDVTVTLAISGRSTDPQIRFSSSPALPQDEIMARLLFGGSVNELSALQIVQLGASLNTLRGSSGGLNPLGQLRSATGLSRLRILGADEATGRGTAISAGFYISNKIYLEVITDTRGFTATQIEIALSKALSLLSQTGTSGSTNINLRYRKQY